MNNLLDTHVLLWAVAEPGRLPKRVRAVIEQRQYTVSIVSLWELINKRDRRGAPVIDACDW